VPESIAAATLVSDAVLEVGSVSDGPFDSDCGCLSSEAFCLRGTAVHVLVSGDFVSLDFETLPVLLSQPAVKKQQTTLKHRAIRMDRLLDALNGNRHYADRKHLGNAHEAKSPFWSRGWRYALREPQSPLVGIVLTDSGRSTGLTLAPSARFVSGARTNSSSRLTPDCTSTCSSFIRPTSIG
jgi:hypothetical protein